MTTVVGMVEGDHVIMMADRMSCWGSMRQILDDKTPKIARVIGADGAIWAIGCSGTLASFQLIQTMTFPTVKDGIHQNPPMFFVKHFVPQMRGLLKEVSLLVSKDGAQVMQGNLLVGVSNILVCIDDHFAVSIVEDGFDGIGSGLPYALGSLHATQNLSTLSARERLCAALQAASHYDTSTGGRFDSVSTEK